MDLIYRLWGRRIQRQLAANSMRPRGFDGMQFAFSGTDGMAYYTWQDVSEMPPCREKQIERAFQMANAGIGSKTLTELCEMAEVANMNQLKATKPEERSRHGSRVAFLLGEIKNRPTEILPEECFFDMVAVMSVREDEDPRVFDTVTHGQKIEMLRAAGAMGYEMYMIGHDPDDPKKVFTKLPILQKSLGFSLTSESAFMELLSGWAAQRMRTQAIRAVYAS